MLRNNRKLDQHVSEFRSSPLSNPEKVLKEPLHLSGPVRTPRSKSTHTLKSLFSSNQCPTSLSLPKYFDDFIWSSYFYEVTLNLLTPKYRIKLLSYLHCKKIMSDMSSVTLIFSTLRFGGRNYLSLSTPKNTPIQMLRFIQHPNIFQDVRLYCSLILDRPFRSCLNFFFFFFCVSPLPKVRPEIPTPSSPTKMMWMGRPNWVGRTRNHSCTVVLERIKIRVRSFFSFVKERTTYHGKNVFSVLLHLHVDVLNNGHDWTVLDLLLTFIELMSSLKT